MPSQQGLRVEPGKIIARRYGSVRKLAEAVGLSHVTVGRTLNGQYRGEKTQDKIAKALGVSRVRLFGEAA